MAKGDEVLDVKLKKISDFQLDISNANRGTQRGRQAIKDSIQRNGSGRSVLADKNGKFIAGNKTSEEAFAAGIEDAIVVKTNGLRLVIVQREDLDLDDPNDPRGRDLAYADNRTAELDLNWDPKQLEEDFKRLDLEHLFSDNEAQQILDRAFLEDDEDGDEKTGNASDGGKVQQESLVPLQLAMKEEDRGELIRILSHVQARHELDTLTDAVLKLACEWRDDNDV